MKVIPVMDLLDGTVVHAVRGEREKYEPVDTVLSDSSDPLSIASEFRKFGFEEIYIADLNAIQERRDNLSTVKKLSQETNFNLIVDAGFRTADDVRPYIENGVSKIVLATETLQNFEEIERVIDKFSVPVVGSVDMKGGELITNFLEPDLSFSEIIRNFERYGVSELILLNLKKVGSSAGPDEELLERTINLSKVPVIIGGGVRNIKDLKIVEELGASGVLIATALHSGSIGPDYMEGL